MSTAKEESINRFQLAGRSTSVNIEIYGKVYPLETRLHLINCDGNILTNILYLTSSQKQGSWLAGFDLIANKVYPFKSKLEVITAINCLLDSFKFTEKLGSSIDTILCRNLVQRINQESEDKAREILVTLCDALKVNVLADEKAISNDLPIVPTGSEPTIKIEKLSLSLKIGKQELADGLLSMLRIGGQGAEDTLLLVLDTNTTLNLPKTDFNDSASFSIDIGQGFKAIFGGIVNEANYSIDGKLTITCRSYALTLQDTIIPGLSMSTFRGAEQIYYMLRSSGWKPESLFLDGLYTGDKKRFCLVITPIPNIETTKSFGIGGVTFSKLEKEQKDAIESLNPKANPNFPELDDDLIWAKTYVSAPHFYEAQVAGLKNIEMALDLLSDVKSDSRPFHYSDQGYIPVSWRRSDRLSRINREPWVYIQDLTTKEYILANTEYVIDVRKLVMTPALLSRLEKGTDKLQILFQKPWDKLNVKEKSLVYALHWLHRARDEGIDIDKLIYLWNAIEFISSSSKPYRLFSKEEVNTIEKLAQDSLSGDETTIVKKKERIADILRMLNDPSLLFKLKQLIESEKIDISEAEWEHIKKSRDKRNEVIHGRTNIVFEESDVNKLSFIVSKIISGLSLRL